MLRPIICCSCISRKIDTYHDKMLISSFFNLLQIHMNLDILFLCTNFQNTCTSVNTCVSQLSQAMAFRLWVPNHYLHRRLVVISSVRPSGTYTYISEFEWNIQNSSHIIQDSICQIAEFLLLFDQVGVSNCTLVFFWSPRVSSIRSKMLTVRIWEFATDLQLFYQCKFETKWPPVDKLLPF